MDNIKKTENFKRLAENRTNKIIDTLELLGNLANKSNYSYTSDQIDVIFKTIQDSIEEQKAKFYKHPVEKKKKFRL